jgi:protein-L-isoaspartate(D-aspartate) O-methyltransferase
MRVTDSMIRGIGMTSQRTRERLVSRLREKGIVDSRVLDIILQTPRHLFVDEALASRAYEDTALPIGYGQTISQPYIVARMTELLLSGGTPQRVLEVGTGCGYQSTVLAQLVKDVFTVERIEALQQQARHRFRQLRLRNVRSRHSDGQWGWPQHAPFDAILVTAAPQTVPEELLGQLNVGGRMVVPVGTARRQHLSVITRTESEYIQDLYEPVSFVPLLGGEI